MSDRCHSIFGSALPRASAVPVKNIRPPTAAPAPPRAMPPMRHALPPAGAEAENERSAALAGKARLAVRSAPSIVAV